MAEKKKTIKKTSKRKKQRKNDKLILIGLIIAVIIFVFVIYKIFSIVVHNNENVNLSGESYYQYFYGIKEEYSGKMEVTKKDDSIQLTLENGKNIYLDSTPMYYKDILGRALIAENMEIVVPDEGAYKLDNFTNIIESNKGIHLKRFNKNNMTPVKNAFLYDGNDLYFFLEETKIKIGGEEYEVSPLSYAIVNYRQNVEIYNYATNEYIIIQEEQLLESNVIATNLTNSYTINLSLDSIKTVKSDQLLIKSVNNLKDYKY